MQIWTKSKAGKNYYKYSGIKGSYLNLNGTQDKSPSQRQGRKRMRSKWSFLYNTIFAMIALTNCFVNGQYELSGRMGNNGLAQSGTTLFHGDSTQTLTRIDWCDDGAGYIKYLKMTFDYTNFKTFGEATADGSNCGNIEGIANKEFNQICLKSHLLNESLRNWIQLRDTDNQTYLIGSLSGGCENAEISVPSSGAIRGF